MSAGLTSVKIADSVIQFSDSIKILGATLDTSLNMGPYTKAISKSCFYHVRSFRQIRACMDRSMAVSVASALVSSRFDYANSVLLQGVSIALLCKPYTSHHRDVCLSVCLSVTCWHWVKTRRARITKSSPTDRPRILVFGIKNSSRNSTVFTPSRPFTYLSQDHEVHAIICQSLTFSSAAVPFVSLRQRYGTPCLLTFCNLKLLIHLDVI